MHAKSKVAILRGPTLGPSEVFPPTKRDWEAQRLSDAAEFNRHSMRIWFVLSVVMSLATFSIFAKYRLVGLSIVPILVIPLSLTLYFKAHIASMGPWVHAATLVLALFAAVVFGI